MRCIASVVTAVLVVLLGSVSSAQPAGQPLRAGVIGTDTSHVMAYYGALSDPKAEGDLADVKIVAAFPGGVQDNPASWDRVEKIAQQLKDKGVEIVDSIPKLLEKVDVVFLESVDGRPHLEQARPVILAGKRMFIDKPVAGSLADAVEIFRLAKEHNCPVFSASSLRFGDWRGADQDPKVGPVCGCAAWSPCSLEEHHPDLFWYGVHGVEILFTVMGPDCKTVSRTQAENTELVVGTWADGRIGTFRGLRDGKKGYGAVIFGTKSTVLYDQYGGYKPLVVEVCKFFKTGVAPVSPEETIAIFAFMEAADESKRQGGCPVSVADVLAKAAAAKH